MPVETSRWMHADRLDANYYGSPVEWVRSRNDWLERRLDEGGPFDLNVLDRLAREGYVEYLMGPMRYSDGTVNAISFATRRPGGFTGEERNLFRRIVPTVSLVSEVRAARRTALNMLNTYVGVAPAERILAGEVRRGETRHIRAAILLSDMRNFTLLSDTRDEAEVIATLNDYFDCVVPAVREEGGEVLKFMGDGVLAMFTDGIGSDSRRSACERAERAARAALAAVESRAQGVAPDVFPVRIGIALHWGEVAYGNIGSGDRLDFTVIGRDVNLASRLAAMCKPLGRTLLLSEAFVWELGKPSEPLGAHAVAGLAEPLRIYAPDAGT
jgi:adenylate cyclase